MLFGTKETIKDMFKSILPDKIRDDVINKIWEGVQEWVLKILFYIFLDLYSFICFPDFYFGWLKLILIIKLLSKLKKIIY